MVLAGGFHSLQPISWCNTVEGGWPRRTYDCHSLLCMALCCQFHLYSSDGSGHCLLLSSTLGLRTWRGNEHETPDSHRSQWTNSGFFEWWQWPWQWGWIPEASKSQLAQFVFWFGFVCMLCCCFWGGYMPLCSCLVVEKSMLYQGGQE